MKVAKYFLGLTCTTTDINNGNRNRFATVAKCGPLDPIVTFFIVMTSSTYAIVTFGYYTKIGPMTRISALYPGAYAPDIERREISGAYAPGYSADIRVIRPNSYIRGIRARGYPQISGAYDPGSLRATLPSPLMPQHFKWNKSETHFLSWCYK